VKIGVVGGGLMGLALALRLSARGHRVTVLERGPQTGGLATWHDFGPFVWDRFYHVILPSDGPLIGFLREIGLGDALHWAATRTGYYVDGRFHNLSSGLDFLRFPPLAMWDKLRLATTILRCSRIDDWRALERVPLEQWLVEHCGRRTFDKFWRPLLLAKLGEHYHRTSAVFIWTYIKRLYSARDTSARREHMGYVRGGYRTVFERIESLVRKAGGEILLGTDVQGVEPALGGGLKVHAAGQSLCFDKVVFTGPVDVLRRVAAPGLVEVASADRDVEYLGVVCLALVTREPFTPYYVLNLGDTTLPFTGVIGMSTVVDPAQTASRHLTYLPKYVLSGDPLLRAPDGEIRDLFLKSLARLFPRLRDDQIESVHVMRAGRVQPLQVIDYSSLVPRPVTRHPDFLVLNTAQFVSNTLNNNEVIRNVDAFLASAGAQFFAARS
jgi:protoporphyrinogen oxidase